MTRDEYRIKQEHSRSLSESMLNAVSYISSLEKRIVELEAEIIRISMHLDRECEDTIHYCKIITELSTPKTCEGCKYEFEYKYLADRTDICTICIRYDKLKDYYEPKDTK